MILLFGGLYTVVEIHIIDYVNRNPVFVNNIRNNVFRKRITEVHFC